MARSNCLGLPKSISNHQSYWFWGPRDCDTARDLGAALALILGTLLYEGFSSIDLAMFTQSTPPPGAAGGLLNAILGSLMMSSFAVLIGTPLGIFAGIQRRGG